VKDHLYFQGHNLLLANKLQALLLLQIQLLQKKLHALASRRLTVKVAPQSREITETPFEFLPPRRSRWALSTTLVGLAQEAARL